MRPKSFAIIFITYVYTTDIPTMGSPRDNIDKTLDYSGLESMCSGKNVQVCFTIISNLAFTTCTFLNNIRADLFLKGILIVEQ